MADTELTEKLARLEAENARLRQHADETAAGGGSGDRGGAEPRRRSRGWSVLSAFLIVIGLVLTPIAIVSGWARLQLSDTDTFVATFAPLAENPDVQNFVASQVVTAINEKVDVPGLTSAVFDGIEQLGLPPKAADALGLLEGPATQGIQALMSRVVDSFVSSPAFADIWAQALRVSHRQLTAALQGSPDSAVEVAGNSLTVQLGPIISAVKDRLVAQGIGFANAIPVIDRDIVIVQSDALALTQVIYSVAVAAGIWLPWLALAFLAAGVLIARRRVVALMWTSGLFALSAAILAAGLGLGRIFFLAAVPALPTAASGAIYDQITALMGSTTSAVITLGITIAVIAWVCGPYRPARTLRGFAGSGATVIRESAARHGVTTGRFGQWLYRWRILMRSIICVVAAALIVFVRPLTAGFIVTTILIAILVFLISELLQRPTVESASSD